MGRRPSPPSISDFSTNQLLEELVRRHNQPDKRKPEKWCDDCKHFVGWLKGPTPNQLMPENYNPCQRKHIMKFMVPEDIDSASGFYLHVCADRKEIEE